MAQFAPPPPQFHSAGAGSGAQPFQPMQPGSAGADAAVAAPPPGTNLFRKAKPAAEQPPPAAEAQPGSPEVPWQAAAPEGPPLSDAPAVAAPLDEVATGWDDYEAPAQDAEMYGAMEGGDGYADLGEAAPDNRGSFEQPVDYLAAYAQETADSAWDSGSAREGGRPSPNRQLNFEQYSRADEAEAEAVPLDTAAVAWAADDMATGQAPSSTRQRLQGLEATIAALQRSQKEVRAAVAQQATQAAAVLESQVEAFDGRLALPRTLAGLTEELAALADARRCVRSMQDIQVSSRLLDKLQKKVEAAAEGDERAAYFQHVAEAISTFSAAADQVAVLRDLDQSPAAQLLHQELEDVCLRVDTTRNALYAVLLVALQRRLEQVGWPLPLTGAAQEGGTGGGAGPFESADDALLAEVQRLILAMAALQRSADPESFAQTDSAAEPPLLWPVVELAAPLEAKFRHHFASGLPTDRIDRPEWLFGTALRVAREGGAALAPLQPALQDPDAAQSYQIQEEYARAVREVVKELLRVHLLPRLLEEGPPAAWIHFAEEAVAFEGQMAEVRGIPAAAEEDADSPLVPSWALGSCLELLFEHEEWRDAWLSAEAAEAVATLEEALDAADAWQCAPHSAHLDLQPHAGASSAADRGGSAWEHEFWAPSCAEAALAITESHARRAAWLPSAQQRAAYMEAVPQAMLGVLHTRLQRLAKTAEDFRDLTGSTWAPKLGAYVCAAHFLEHHLRESPLALLLLTEQNGEVAADEDAAEAAAPLEDVAARFGKFQQQWVNKLAVGLTAGFTRLSDGYRRSLGAFAATGASVGEMEASPRLLLALEETSAGLARLAGALDAVAFRAVWRGFAASVNKLLYNDCATEARFSPQGSAQFAADCEALLTLLRPYTPRPGAHFKELLDASRLLSLAQDQAFRLHSALQTAAPEERQAALRCYNIARLSPERALVVLNQRFDMAEA